MQDILPRPYFIHHLTAKRFAKDLMAGSSIYYSKKVVKTVSRKFEITRLLWILAKELVRKRFFDLFAIYINIKLPVKVISSLARALQKLVGIRFFFIWLEVRFFNFVMNKANCNWLTLILNMAHLYQSKTINTVIDSALRNQQVQVELEDFMNVTYGIFDIFQILDNENKSVTQIIPCLAILLKNSESDITNIVEKSTVNSLASIHFQCSPSST